MSSRGSRVRLLAVLVAAGLLLILWLLRDGGTGGGEEAAATRAAASGEGRRGALAGGEGGGHRAAASAEDDGPLLALEGRVIWADGRPAEAATVRILSRPGAGRTTFASDRVVLSDAQGEFAFEMQAPGAYVLQAQKDDDVSASVPVTLADGTPPVTLVLIPGASLVVTVASAFDGRPIAGARVRVELANHQVLSGDAFVEAVTDAAGQAWIRGLDPVANHAVWAEADGYAGKYVNVLPMQHATTRWELRLLLSPGAVVSGRVVDARGQGVPGALVGWSHTQETLEELGFRVFMPFSDQGRMSEQVTDGQGRYRMTVPPGWGCAVAEKPQLRIGLRCQVMADPGRETTGVDLVLLDGARVAGRVVDRAGLGVAGAEVRATIPEAIHQPSMAAAYRYRARSGADGKFVLLGLPPLAIALVATTEDASSALVDVDVQRGPVSDVVLRLEHDGTLEGEVVEADGRPVPYAAVNYWFQPDFPALARANSGKPPEVIREYAHPTNNGATVADAEGRFQVRGLLPGKYAVRASRPTATAMPAAFGSAAHYQVPTGSAVRIVLPGLGAIKGRVRTDGGQPVRRFGVSLLAEGGADAPDYLFSDAHLFATEDGAFLLSGVPANRYVLRVSGDEIVSKRVKIEVRGADTADAGTIVVEKGQPARPGLVIDEAREPQARATITIALADPPGRIEIWSEEDGTFRVPALPAGAMVRLRADTGGGASEWVTLGPADRAVTLVVVSSGNGAVRGVLVDVGDLNERPVILAHPGDKPPGTGTTQVRAMTVTQPGGQFVFENVPPGTYVLWAPLGGAQFARHPAPIEVQKGRDVSVVFDVESSPRVSP